MPASAVQSEYLDDESLGKENRVCWGPESKPQQQFDHTILRGETKRREGRILGRFNLNNLPLPSANTEMTRDHEEETETLLTLEIRKGWKPEEFFLLSIIQRKPHGRQHVDQPTTPVSEAGV